ncbi:MULTISPECIES: galactose ABC transporter substrate-binding protein [unclassified Clostridium]|uniref:galactose ABC transporter substrate-binding protein n=1 Tax=unclassified Clostridium TaxID=2614128 RepID=UPI000297C474|nr:MULTISPECIES: galactose ABC transporter substrate-binding protein [unclassified Clostridium]EKQ54448.1 MAG: ABC-type sugar transport system, periplasmic component [Clostridium sp. Maddingley MBC34-26]
MNILKKVIYITIIFILLHSTKGTAYASLNIVQNPVKVAVFLNNFNDPFISNVKKSLENIEKENEKKVQFTFFDAKSNQTIQNESIVKELNDKNFDLFVVNLVSNKISDVESTFNKIFQNNMPLILHLAPSSEFANVIKSYGKAVIIGSNEEQSGTLQGKILVDAWNAKKETIDKNKDDILQYVILKGPADSISTIFRTKYSIGAINNAGIKTQELLSVNCNWNEECAKTTIESALLTLDGKIEAIISNNDAMAIGAIKTLQKYGYNKEDKSKYIPVVGIDALPEAQALIKKGIMTGTVLQDPRELATAIYIVGMNMISGRYPLEGTNYKFDETGNTIRIPYHPYTNLQ